MTVLSLMQRMPPRLELAWERTPTLLEQAVDRTTRRAVLEPAVVGLGLLALKRTDLPKMTLSRPCAFVLRTIVDNPARCQLDLAGALEDAMSVIAGSPDAVDDAMRGAVHRLASSAAQLSVGQLAELGDLTALATLLAESL